MGRIKSKMVKNTAKQLLLQEHDFTKDFGHNKKIINDIMPSKPIRNKIAGYIARLMKQKQEKPKKQEMVSPISSTVDQSFSQDY